LGSAFVFWQSVTNIAKFSRPFNEPALSSYSFFVSCSLIAKAVDCSACHLGCFAFGTLAELTDGGSVSETTLDEPTDSLGPRRKILLLATPLIDGVQERPAQTRFQSARFFIHEN
jgi:hypothetical protein